MVRVLGRHISVLAAVCVAVLPAGIAWGTGDWRRDWATLHNERHGFLIAYPIGVFAQKSDPTTDEGRALYSPDGQAQLLVGAFANADHASLKDYRGYLMREQYAGAVFDYAPVHDRWFVLSGTIGDREFYERVSFTCGGQLINSWAMIYPIAPRAQNRFYDNVVEAIAQTYTPGAGRSGNCD